LQGSTGIVPNSATLGASGSARYIAQVAADHFPDFGGGSMTKLEITYCVQ